MVARKTLEDQETHAAQVRTTDLEWTIVRAPFLTEGKGTGTYHTRNISLGVERLSQSNLSRFLLDCVEGDYFVRELPQVGKA